MNDIEEAEEEAFDTGERVIEINVSEVIREKAALAAKYFQTLHDYFDYLLTELDAGNEPEPKKDVEADLTAMEKEMEAKGFAKIREWF
jgi:hypothetical protein